MSNNPYYDINYGTIPSTCIPAGYGSDTITLDYSTQPSVVLNSTMSGSGSYIISTTDNTSVGTYNPFNGYKNIGVGTTGSNDYGIRGFHGKPGSDKDIWIVKMPF